MNNALNKFQFLKENCPCITRYKVNEYGGGTASCKSWALLHDCLLNPDSTKDNGAMNKDFVEWVNDLHIPIHHIKLKLPAIPRKLGYDYSIAGVDRKRSVFPTLFDMFIAIIFVISVQIFLSKE